MKKINTSPISGMQELLPEKQATFNSLKNIIGEVYHCHGFLNIETPIIEREEILLAKAGGDTEKQIYKVVKTAEAKDGADQALRFDHTVPLARYVVEHENDLAFPFKVSQIGRNFRGERAQKGRYREFYQCDADVIGRNSLPIYYDADVIETSLDALLNFGLNTPVVARISNRKILSGLISELGVEDKSKDIYSIIDHSEKVPAEETEEAFTEIGLSNEKKALILAFMDIYGAREYVVDKLRNLGVGDQVFNDGVKELDIVLRLLEADGYKENIKADMKIVRGLDYYTGTVFEYALPEYQQVGSIGGGGRYDNLTGHFTEQVFPGVGSSIGLTRLFYVLNENNLLKSQVERPLEVAVVPISENEIEYAFKVAKEQREKGKATTVVLSGKKLGDKLNYAAKLAKVAIIIGEDEVKTGELKEKILN